VLEHLPRLPAGLRGGVTAGGGRLIRGGGLIRAGCGGGLGRGLSAVGLVVKPVEQDAQPDQLVQGGDVDLAGDHGITDASQVIPRAAAPSSHAPPSLPVTDAAARCAAHFARTAVIHSPCRTDPPSIARSSGSDTCTIAFTGCPARSGSSPAATSRVIASSSAS
jgi:hypothetical protein